MKTSGGHQPINYTVGDATSPNGDGERVIVHVCNDVGGWGAGFVLALSARWPEPEQSFRRWFATRDTPGAPAGTPPFELGAVQLVSVEPFLWVANLIGQRDLVDGPDGPPIRYEAIEEGLATLADEVDAMGGSVHMPRIGCGLAGGEWDRIEPIIERTLIERRIDVTVYDLD